MCGLQTLRIERSNFLWWYIFQAVKLDHSQTLESSDGIKVPQFLSTSPLAFYSIVLAPSF
jgi:hypothetical protein